MTLNFEGIEKKYSTIKEKRPLLARFLYLFIPIVLFLGVLPYEKSALFFYASSLAGEIFSYVLEGITALLTIFLFLRNRKDRKILILLSGLVVVFALITFGWVVGSLKSDTFHVSRILSLGCLFIYYAFVVLYFKNKDDFFYSLSISCLFLILLSLVLYLAKNEHVIYYAGFNKQFFKGISKNRNSFFELSIVPFVFFIYFGFKTKKIKFTITFFALASVALGATILTNSITSIIILAISLIVILLRRWSYYFTNPYLIISVSALIIVLLLASSKVNFLGWFFELIHRSTDATGRTELWETAWKSLSNEVVFGGGFDVNWLTENGAPHNDPHNGFLYLLLTQGIFGALIAISLIVIATRKDKSSNTLYQYITIFIWAWCIRSTVESGFSYTHFIFWAAIIMSIRIRLETESKFPPVPEVLKNNKSIFDDKVAIKKASTSTGMLFLLTFAKMVFPLLTLPYLTRVLSTDTYGTVSYVKALMGYVQVVIDFGFLYSAVKDIAKLGEDKNGVNKVLSDTILAKIILALLSFLVVFVCCLTIPILRNNFVFSLLSFLTPLFSIFVYDFLFRGIEKMQFTTICFVITKFISTVLVFVFVKGDSNIILIPIFDLLGTIVASLIATIVLFKNGYALTKPSFKDAFKSLQTSLPYFVNVIASTAFGVFITLVIGIAIPDATEISYWAVSMQLVAAVQSLYTPLCNGIYPYMIKKKNLKMISTILIIFMPVIILGTLFCYFYAPLIIQVISGEAYISGAYVFKALSPVLLLSFLVAMLGWPVLGPINKTKEMTISTLVGAGVQVLSIGLLLIINQFNLLAIAITRIISEFAMLAMKIYYLIRFKSLFYKEDARMNIIGLISNWSTLNQFETLEAFSLKSYFESEGFSVASIEYDSQCEKKTKESNEIVSARIKSFFKNGIFRPIFYLNKSHQVNKFKRKNKMKASQTFDVQHLSYLVYEGDCTLSLSNLRYFEQKDTSMSNLSSFSFATNFGANTLDILKKNDDYKSIAVSLGNLKAVSVSDDNSFEIVKELSNKSPVFVCNPLIAFDYHNFFTETELDEFKEELYRKYCIIYSSEGAMNDKETIKAVKEYAKARKLVTVSIGTYHKWCSLNLNCPLLDLYKYFKFADIVFTDTYYGAAISVVTNTQFVVAKSNDDKGLISLVEKYNLQSTLVEDFKNINSEEIGDIDFDEVNKKTSLFREEAKAFLRSQLNG